MEDLIQHYNRLLSKEERDELEKDYLFKHRYDNTYDAIGYYWDSELEEEE